jgi:hypothetical protein
VTFLAAEKSNAQRKHIVVMLATMVEGGRPSRQPLGRTGDVAALHVFTTSATM